MANFNNYVKSFTMKNPWTNEEMEMTCEYDMYAFGGIYLQLYCKDENGFNEPYCTASVCVPHTLEDNEIAIKDYDANAGILEALIENKVIAEPHRYVSSGHVATIPVCTLIEVKK